MSAVRTATTTRRDASAAPGRPPRRRRNAGHRAQLVASAVLMSPFMLILTGVFLVPVSGVLYLSFFTRSETGLGFGPGETTFAGFRSYLAVLTDPTFLQGILVTGLFVVLYVPLLAVLALALALLLDSGLVRLRSAVQLGLFLPHAVPGIVAGIIWLYLYTPGLSPVLRFLAEQEIRIDLLGVDTVVPALVNILLWNNLGYNIVIFYAALQAVPREVLEAARVDGAGAVRSAVQIKVPLVRSSVVMVVIFSVIGALQLFTEPMLLNTATPVIGSRLTPNMYIYDAAFTRNNYGLAAAASVILLAVTVALSFVVTRWSSRNASEEDAL